MAIVRPPSALDFWLAVLWTALMAILVYGLFFGYR
jgi:hypothetical protein